MICSRWLKSCCSKRSWLSSSRPLRSVGLSGSRSSRARITPPSSWLGLRNSNSKLSGAPCQKRCGNSQRQALSKRSPCTTVSPSTFKAAASAHQRSAKRTCPWGFSSSQAGGHRKQYCNFKSWPPLGQITNPRASQSARCFWPQG